MQDAAVRYFTISYLFITFVKDTPSWARIESFYFSPIADLSNGVILAREAREIAFPSFVNEKPLEILEYRLQHTRGLDFSYTVLPVNEIILENSRHIFILLELAAGWTIFERDVPV